MKKDSSMETFNSIRSETYISLTPDVIPEKGHYQLHQESLRPIRKEQHIDEKLAVQTLY